MSDRQEPPSGAAIATPSIGTWAGFLLMCLGMFMAILDIQVVATSLPAIQQALAISPDAMIRLLTAQRESASTFGRFYESLPVAGTSSALFKVITPKNR